MTAFSQVFLVVLFASAVSGVNQLKGKVFIPNDADSSFVTTTKVLLDGGQYVVRFHAGILSWPMIPDLSFGRDI
jgi:hypothetical protein